MNILIAIFAAGVCAVGLAYYYDQEKFGKPNALIQCFRVSLIMILLAIAGFLTFEFWLAIREGLK